MKAVWYSVLFLFVLYLFATLYFPALLDTEVKLHVTRAAAVGHLPNVIYPVHLPITRRSTTTLHQIIISGGNVITRSSPTVVPSWICSATIAFVTFYLTGASLQFVARLRAQRSCSTSPSPSTIHTASWSVLPVDAERVAQDDGVPSASGVELKQALLDAIATIPSGKSSDAAITGRILALVEELERTTPAPVDLVARHADLLGGAWLLVWTAQPVRKNDGGGLLSLGGFINPIENQAYANNPMQGVANPILPADLQRRLENLFGAAPGTLVAPTAMSTQIIDVPRRKVINVVRFQAPFGIAGTVRVEVAWQPAADPGKGRRVDVKFERCQLSGSRLPSLELPLGPFGPPGWLETTVVDRDIRI
eukprot:EG_transcript_16954